MSTSIIMAVFKPALRKKFELKILHKVVFKANKTTDTLNLEGTGCKEKSSQVETINLNTLKLSENSEYIDVFMNKVKGKIKNLGEIKATNLTIDFENKFIESEIFYINTEGQKLKVNIKNDL